MHGPAPPLDPEQPITVDLLWRLYTGLQLQEEISPRLILRAIEWSAKETSRMSNQIARAAHVLGEGQR